MPFSAGFIVGLLCRRGQRPGLVTDLLLRCGGQLNKPPFSFGGAVFFCTLPRQARDKHEDILVDQF